MNAFNPPSIWLLVDNQAGNQSQCLGVGEALSLKFEIRDLDYTPAAALPNFVMGKTFGGLSADSRINLVPPWPDVVIAAGRRCSPVARHIKDKNDGKTFLVQIMYPGDTGLDEFDLVCAPRHDAIGERNNIFQTTGAPHRVTPQRLATAREDWRERLKHLPGPRLALIVGGSTKRRKFTEQMARELGAAVSKMAMDAGGSVMLTTSRRSNDTADALIDEIKAPKEVFKWGDEGENPYLGFLALADGVIVTGDSVSMCCEAAATPGPVWIYAPKKLTIHKHGALHRQLYDDGYAKPFDANGGTGFQPWEHAPLNAAFDIAGEIKNRLALYIN
ncbi:MAG TPA: mitochondrial fission ELM1 family protein [Rhodospirillales bacterium]|nr:mitochondrial fission ELM1 family protein [Rhodospirillales bacterium]